MRRVARSLALDGVEIGGHGNHNVGYGFAQKGFGIFFELLQHQRRQLFGTEIFAAEAEGFVGAHKAFESRSGGLRRGAQTLAGGQADKDIARIVGADHRRGEKVAEAVGNQAGFAVEKLGDQAVGGAQIDADLQGHGGFSQTFVKKARIVKQGSLKTEFLLSGCSWGFFFARGLAVLPPQTVQPESGFVSARIWPIIRFFLWRQQWRAVWMSNHKTNRLRKTACGKPAISANTACLMSWRKFAESTESIPNAPCFLMWAARLTTIVFTKPNISMVGSCTGASRLFILRSSLRTTVLRWWHNGGTLPPILIFAGTIKGLEKAWERFCKKYGRK